MGKTTEFDKLRRDRRRKKTLKHFVVGFILLLFVGVCAISATFVYQLDLGTQADNLLSSLKKGGGFPVVMDDVNILGLAPLGQDVAVLTSSGTYLYNSKGARLATCMNDYENPQTRVGDGKLLTYDLGGTGLRVDSKAKELYTVEMEGGTLLAADIARNGGIAMAQTASGFSAKVMAYTPRFELMYTWNVTDSYITDLALSQKGTMMSCAGLVAQGQHLVSYLRIHHFDKDEEIAKVPLEDQVIVSMVWTQDETIQVLTDKAIYLFDKTGNELAREELPSSLVTFENVPGGIYIAYGDYRSAEGVRVDAYDGKLKKQGSVTLDRRLLSLSCDSGHLLLLTEGQLYLSDRYLKEVKPRQFTGLYYVCGVGSSIYGITPEGLVKSTL